MKKIVNNLKFRLLLGLCCFLFIVFYGFGYFLIHSLTQTYIQTIEASLVTALKDIKHDYKDTRNEIEETLNDIKEEFNIYPFYAQVSSLEKNTQTVHSIARSEDLKNEMIVIDKKRLEALAQTKEGLLFTTDHLLALTQEKIKMGHMILAETNDTVTVLSCGTEYKRHTPYVEQMKSRLWIGFGALLVMILLGVYTILSRSFLSVQRVIDEARSIHVEDIGKKMTKTHMATELDNLIDTFNALIFELQNAYRHVKQFGQNASHELKTPMTIIRGEIEIGLKKERTPQEYQQILHTIHQEVSVLQDIIEKILFLSTIHQKGNDAYFETVYIDEIVQESVEEKRNFAKAREVFLHVKTFDALTLKGNASLLKIAIGNLLDNAIKYSPAHTTVVLALSGKTLCIENEGEGIGEEEIPHVFERFYRGKKTLGIAGSGLGLSLVEAIMTLHGFRVDIKSIPNEVTTVSIAF